MVIVALLAESVYHYARNCVLTKYLAVRRYDKSDAWEYAILKSPQVIPITASIDHPGTSPHVCYGACIVLKPFKLGL